MQLFEDFIRQFSIYLENEESAFDDSKTEEMLRGMKKALSTERNNIFKYADDRGEGGEEQE